MGRLAASSDVTRGQHVILLERLCVQQHFFRKVQKKVAHAACRNGQEVAEEGEG